MKTIVVAVDFSDLTNRLIDHAVELAVQFRASLRLVHIMAPEPAFVGYAVYAYPGPDEREEELRQEKEQLRELVEAVRRRGVEDVSGFMKEAETVPGLLDFARETGADLLVLGTHHRNFLERALMGSAAQAAVRRSHIPVLIVPTVE